MRMTVQHWRTARLLARASQVLTRQPLMPRQLPPRPKGRRPLQQSSRLQMAQLKIHQQTQTQQRQPTQTAITPMMPRTVQLLCRQPQSLCGRW